jgi:hydroxyethylthiazole kinase
MSAIKQSQSKGISKAAKLSGAAQRGSEVHGMGVSAARHTVQEKIVAQSLYDDVQLIRKAKPVIHNITNYVAMQTIANMLLALGASPIMAHAQEELVEIVQLSQALVINIGTLDEGWINNMHYAQREALKRRLPIILDPVGAGATILRTAVARDIMGRGVDVVRGNASEILSLADNSMSTKGVDAQHTTGAALEAAQQLAQAYKCVVVVSGEVDFVISVGQKVEDRQAGKERAVVNDHAVVNDQLIEREAIRQFRLDYGSPMLTRVTGMGCSVTALIAAFCAVNRNYAEAAAHAMTLLGCAAEIAEQRASGGPGSFYVALLDVLYSLGQDDLLAKIA